MDGILFSHREIMLQLAITLTIAICIGRLALNSLTPVTSKIEAAIRATTGWTRVKWVVSYFAIGYAAMLTGLLVVYLVANCDFLVSHTSVAIKGFLNILP